VKLSFRDFLLLVHVVIVVVGGQRFATLVKVLNLGNCEEISRDETLIRFT